MQLSSLRGLSVFLVAALMVAGGCDLFGSESDDPAYVGTWVSEEAAASDDFTAYLDITSSTVTKYEIGEAAIGGTSCIEKVASIASYNDNIMTLETDGEEREYTVEVQDNQLQTTFPAGADQVDETYMSTDVNPEERLPDVSCVGGNFPLP